MRRYINFADLSLLTIKFFNIIWAKGGIYIGSLTSLISIAIIIDILLMGFEKIDIILASHLFAICIIAIIFDLLIADILRSIIKGLFALFYFKNDFLKSYSQKFNNKYFIIVSTSRSLRAIPQFIFE